MKLLRIRNSVLAAAALIGGQFNLCHAEFHVWQQRDGGGKWVWAIGVSEQNAAESLQWSSMTNAPPREPYFSKINSCTSPGWFAVVQAASNVSGWTYEYGGGCGMPSRARAKEAAISSCKSKPKCAERLARGQFTLHSGFDSGNFDRVTVSRNLQAQGRGSGWNTEAAGEQYEECGNFNADGTRGECFDSLGNKTTFVRP